MLQIDPAESIIKNQTMLTNNPTNHNIKAWNRRGRGGRREAKYEQLCGPLRSPRLIFFAMHSE